MPVYIKFASQIYFELYRDLIDGTKFYVKPLYEGDTIPIVGCNSKTLSFLSQRPLLAQNKMDGSIEEIDGYCDLQTFLDTMEDLLYIGDEDRLKDLCN